MFQTLRIASVYSAKHFSDEFQSWLAFPINIVWTLVVSQLGASDFHVGMFKGNLIWLVVELVTCCLACSLHSITSFEISSVLATGPSLRGASVLSMPVWSLLWPWQYCLRHPAIQKELAHDVWLQRNLLFLDFFNVFGFTACPCSFCNLRRITVFKLKSSRQLWDPLYESVCMACRIWHLQSWHMLVDVNAMKI